MSAVAELDDTIRDHIQNWKPPEVGIGDVIVFYPNCDNRKESYCARVCGKGSRSIDLIQEFGGAAYARHEVHHIDDPKLKYTSMAREYGGWDYSDQMKRVMALEGRVAKLEEFATEPKKGAKP